MSIDRRQFKRFETLLIVEISPQKEGASYFFGITRNVSFEGFIFESQNYNLQPGDVLEFRLKHPQSDLSLPVLGEIVWNREMKFEFHSGVKFLRFDSETRSKVFELISAGATDYSGDEKPDKIVRNTAKRNGRSEPASQEREDVISDVIGQAATDSAHQHRKDDLRNAEPPSRDNRKEGESVSYGSSSGGDSVDASENADNGHDAREHNKERMQEPASETARRAITVRRKTGRKGRPYTLAALFFVLVLSAALVLILSRNLREKMTPFLNRTFLAISAGVNRNGDMPVLNKSEVSQPSPVPADPLEPMPDEEVQTPGKHAFADSEMPFSREPDSDFAGLENDGGDAPMDEDPLPARGEPARETSALLTGKHDTSLYAASPANVPPVRTENDKVSGQITGIVSGKESSDRTTDSVPEKKKETVKIDSTPMHESPLPVDQAVHVEKPEKPAAPIAEDLQKERIQGEKETAPEGDNGLVMKPSGPTGERMTHRKRTVLPAGIRELGDVQSGGKQGSLQGIERSEKIPAVKGTSSGGDRTLKNSVKTVKKSMAAAAKSEPGVKRVSEPEEKTPPQTEVAGNDITPPEPAVPVEIKKNGQKTMLDRPPGGDVMTEKPVKTVKKAVAAAAKSEPGVKRVSEPEEKTPPQTEMAGNDITPPEPAGPVGIKEKIEQKTLLDKSEAEKDGDAFSSEEFGTESSVERKGIPKIALVLQNRQSSISDVERQPALSDAYLKEYFTEYMDPFDDNSNKWDLFDIGAASAGIEDGSYHIENRREGGTLIVLHYKRFPHESDFVIETAVMAIKGLDKNSYGFIFGAKDARDNYSFQIRENKYYAVQNYNNGIPSTLTSGEIKDSSVQKNSAAVLKIVKQNDDIKFYINDVYKTEVSNIEFYGNQIGFIVEGRSHIAIDYTRSYVRNADRGQTR